jgi:hypothetical protein
MVCPKVTEPKQNSYSLHDFAELVKLVQVILGQAETMTNFNHVC